MWKAHGPKRPAIDRTVGEVANPLETETPEWLATFNQLTKRKATVLSLDAFRVGAVPGGERTVH